MPVKTRFFSILLAAFLLPLAAGCGDDGGEPDCEGVADLCEDELGNYRCSTDSGAIEICQHNEDGCPVWTEYQVCGTDEVCDDSGDAPECTCEDVCATAGDTRCQGTVIQTCTEGTDGCNDWVDGTDCADSSQVCSVAGGTAQCADECTDECDYQDQAQCNLDMIEVCNMGADGCLHWEEEQDCGLDLQTCDDSSGTPTCVSTCTGNCAIEERTECAETVIQTCTMDTDGCLYWVSGTDCADSDQVCEIIDLVATCVDECVDQCDTVDATQCSGTVIQTCTEGTDGCNDWVDGDDCADTGFTCDDTTGDAECVTGGGDSCTDVQVIPSTPFTKTGTNFTTDYTDAMAFTDTDTCYDRTSGQVEAVFSISLVAGETLRVEEAGGLDAVVSVQATCGNDEACLVSTDSGTTDTVTYEATADGTVYIIVESWYSSPPSTDYDIRVDVAREDCGDSADNDYDGLVDCDDPNCFGDSTYCTSEENCMDGGDNDGDGSIDCADDDCSDDVFCFESCANPIAVTTFPYQLTGADFFAAFDDDQTLSGPGCMTRTGSVEAVFTVSLTAGEGIRVIENGSLDAVISIQDTCGDSEACLVSDDDGLQDTITYMAKADGTVYVIVEAYWTTSSNAAFDILIEKGVAEVCDDTTDNDFDGLADCDDADCYGVGSCAALPATLVINEIAYDNISTDDREMVELYAPSGAMDLTGISLVHINGSDGTEIWSAAIDLDYYQTDDAGFFLIGSSYYSNADAHWADFGVNNSNALQNDAESLVLYYDYGGSSETVLDTVEYEGDGAGPGEGNPSAGVGHGNWNTSIGRYPDGTDTNDNATDLPALWFTTPGEANLPGQPDEDYRNSGLTNTSITFPVTVPDNDATGVALTQTVAGGAPATIGNIHVGVRISHGWIGDLYVTLTSPTGTTVILHDNTGGGDDDIVTVYDFATAVDDTSYTMDSFNGENPAGDWTLHVADTDAAVTGEVIDWFVLMSAP